MRRPALRNDPESAPPHHAVDGEVTAVDREDPVEPLALGEPHEGGVGQVHRDVPVLRHELLHARHVPFVERQDGKGKISFGLSSYGYDMRVAEDDAVLGVFCRRWGVPLIDGGTVRLPRLIGMGHALDMILTGRPVGAAEALQMGLANRVVPDGTAREAAEALAAEIARHPQTCMRQDRLSSYEQWAMPMESALRNEFRRGHASLAAGDAHAGATRFSKGEGKHGTSV